MKHMRVKKLRCSIKRDASNTGEMQSLTQTTPSLEKVRNPTRSHERGHPRTHVLDRLEETEIGWSNLRFLHFWRSPMSHKSMNGMYQLQNPLPFIMLRSFSLSSVIKRTRNLFPKRRKIEGYQ